MLHSRDFAFIHVPKTGGMSVTRFLINAVEAPVTVFAPANAEAHCHAMAETPQALEKLSYVHGKRHETCEEACAQIEGHGLPVPPHAFSVVRHPFDLMLSYYKHMRKPWIWKQRGMSANTLRDAPKLAMELDFEEFCDACAFYDMTDEDLTRYYCTACFETFEIVPMERLSSYLSLRLPGIATLVPATLERKNASIESIHLDGRAEAMRQRLALAYPQIAEIHARAMAAGGWLNGR